MRPQTPWLLPSVPNAARGIIKKTRQRFNNIGTTKWYDEKNHGVAFSNITASWGTRGTGDRKCGFRNPPVRGLGITDGPRKMGTWEMRTHSSPLAMKPCGRF